MMPLLPLLTVCAMGAAVGSSEDEALKTVAQRVLRDVPPDELEGEWPRWEGGFDGGASLRSGNDSTRNFRLDGNLGLRREHDRLRGAAFWRYDTQRQSDGELAVSERHYGGSMQYDLFLDAREYLLVGASGERDFKSQLDLRLTSGVGYGYQFREDETLSLSAELGAGWFYEDFAAREASDSLSGRLAVNWIWNPLDRLSVEQHLEHCASFESLDDTLSRLESSLRYELKQDWYALFSWHLRWDSEPAADEVRGDHDVALTLGWSF